VLQLGRKLSVSNDTLMLSTEFSKAHNSALRQLSLLRTFARWLLKAQRSNILPLNLEILMLPTKSPTKLVPYFFNFIHNALWNLL
jgi:hypothetical protein